jgi:hypothetical protein
MSETLVLDLFLTIASSALDDSFLNRWNCLMLETFYLLFRASKPSSLAENQATQPRRDLAKLLETEERSKREERRKWTSSRHSRFGTTIAVKSKGDDQEKVILHKQAAVGKSAVEVLDKGKRTLAKRAKMRDALGSTTILTMEAKTILQGVAREFIISCFNRACHHKPGSKGLTGVQRSWLRFSRTSVLSALRSPRRTISDCSLSLNGSSTSSCVHVRGTLNGESARRMSWSLPSSLRWSSGVGRAGLSDACGGHGRTNRSSGPNFKLG